MQNLSKAPAFSSIRTALLSAVTCTSVLLVGCAGMSSPSSQVASTTQVEFFPQCYEPVKQLRSSDEAMGRSVAIGAVTGGLMGALGGALVDDEKRGRNAAIGAAGGALAGGAVAYYSQRQQQITDDNARLASYATDIDTNNQAIDRNIRYASAAQSCYQQAFTQLRADRKANKISDADGRKRLAEIVSGLSETNALLAKVDGRTGENVSTYTQAYEKDLQAVGVQRQDVTKVATAKQPKPTTKVTKEVITTEQSLQKAQAKQKESQQVASRGRTLVSEVCSNPDMGDWAPASCKA
ncbi:Glycine zipper [Pseudomonas flavescens]|uniref:Glycine zipper n=1 Tax=Phytopseudomonas flavescens TaxID=29435 RepID=A0A1G8A6G2_9GAMM|nr:type VI secretion system-associated lipoprotein TagQ [Pseudomonas flavescens]SDH16446.1 Glycine zipper [Pseudomonas flavescens]